MKITDYLSYNEITGEFIWIKSTSNRCKIGKKAGCLDKHGYVVIRFNNKLYKAHRLAWLFFYNCEPEIIDHINRDRKDNRIINLRSVSMKENGLNKSIAKNNKTKKTGVSYCNFYKKYVSYIDIDGKRKNLGYRKSLKEAIELRKKWEILLYNKEFPS
jgi:hypothetical protein